MVPSVLVGQIGQRPRNPVLENLRCSDTGATATEKGSLNGSNER